MPRIRSPLVELVVPARAEFLQVVRLVMAGVGNTLRFDAEQIEDLKLAVGEACYTAFRLEPAYNQQVVIRSWLEDRRLVVDVLQRLRRQDAPSYFPLGGTVEKGIGIVLMNHLMDQVRYRTDSTSVQIRLVKFLPVP